MDKRYFYLGSDRSTPRGPHSTAELSAMLLRGELSPATEVAAEGDKRWQPLGRLLMAAASPAAPVEGLPPVPGAEDLPLVPGADQPVGDGPIGPCPGCGTELSSIDGRCPTKCPDCGFRLSTRTGSMWENISLALRRPFTWRGRSTRKEYWSTWLFYLLVIVPIITIWLIGVLILLSIRLEKISLDELTLSAVLNAPDMLPVWLSGGGLVVYVLWFWLMFLSLTIRRLHDTGHSAWLVIVQIVLTGAWNTLYFYRIFFILKAFDWAELFTRENVEEVDQSLNQLELQINQVAYEGAGGILYLVTMGISLIIFVLSVSDSSPMKNKYGPSPKYPRPTR